MISVRTNLPQYLQKKWSGLKMICRIERWRETKTFCSQEVVYAITSLPPKKASEDQLLQLARDHWQVENKLHYVLDVTFREDACSVCSGTAPEVLSELRKAVLTMIRTTGQKPRAAREIYAEQKQKAIKLVMNWIALSHYGWRPWCQRLYPLQLADYRKCFEQKWRQVNYTAIMAESSYLGRW